MNSKNHENQIAEATKRECDAIVKVLDVLNSCPVPVTQTEVIRRVCKENAFLGVRKLGPLFHVMVIEHNRGIDTTYSNT